MKRAVCLSLLVAAALARPAGATSVVPVDDMDLVRSAPWIVAATVTGIRSAEFEDGAIRTDVTLAVEEVLRGDFEAELLVLRLLGGVVGDRAMVVEGNPRLGRGERTLLFAAPGPDGMLRPLHLAQGVRVVDEGPDGVRRTEPGGRRLEDWRALVWLADAHDDVPAPGPALAPERASGARPLGPGEQRDFTFLTEPAARFVEPDSGQVVAYRIEDGGEPSLASRGFPEVRAALAAWSAVESSRLELGDGGFYTTAGLCAGASPPFSHLSFGDPCDEIPDPVGCAGTAALGGYFSTSSPATVIGGRSFWRITRGFVVFANNFGCLFGTPANLSEVATHEIGHSLGLGHSSENLNEDDPRLSEAIMFPVTHADGRGATLGADDQDGARALYLAPRFLDVPISGYFAPFIERLAVRGITTGCGAGNYCPAAPVTREQMAVFLLRSLGMASPPAPAGQTFEDVPASSPYWPWVEELARRGITGGCGGGRYCPQAAVTRGQMAVFIVRALGLSSPPAPATPTFGDVPKSDPFYAFIEELVARGVTAGCQSAPRLYCPTASVTREQMARFLVTGFGL